MNNKILIAADIVPSALNKEKFINCDAQYLVGDKLLERLHNADYVIMNLEVPLTDEESPIRKCGPCLIASPSTVNGIKAINPYFFTLANNHILDQGVSGLYSTIKILNDNGFDFSGVGNNLTEARKPFVKEIAGVRVGIYCCAEHEFSVATENTPGANPYDPLESFDDVRNLKTICDYLIVLYHGGKEHYRYPSPMLQKVFHKFADVGANLVIAQHTHCIGCMEEYYGSTLVYGQGNFLFDNSDSEYWKTSLLLEVDIKTKKISFIPLKKIGEKVREAEEDAEIILTNFKKRSEEIMKDNFIENNYLQFAEEVKTDYLLRFSGRLKKNIFMRVFNKLSSYRFVRWIYSDENAVAIENVLDCEAHRELALKILSKKNNM